MNRTDLKPGSEGAHLLVNGSLAVRVGCVMSTVLRVDAMVAVCRDCRRSAAKGSIGAAAEPIQDPLERMQEAEAHNAADDT